MGQVQAPELVQAQGPVRVQAQVREMGEFPNLVRDGAEDMVQGKARARTRRKARTIPLRTAPDSIPRTEQVLHKATVCRTAPGHRVDTEDTAGTEDTADRAQGSLPHAQEGTEELVEEGRWEDKADSSDRSRSYLLARPLSARIVVRDDRGIHDALAVLC
jgi:hypothetical protein